MTMDRFVLSGVAGSISLACWIIVFTPQLYENWRRKSAEGLSLAFVVIWLLGDLFNVFGAVLQHVLPTMIILAIYYTLADAVLLAQCLVYGTDQPGRVALDAGSDAEAATNAPAHEAQPLLASVATEFEELERRSGHATAINNALIVLTVVLCGVLGYFLGGHNEQFQDPKEPQPLSFWGQVLGWICACLYLMSRVPQIMLNHRRKSTDGVALLFFVFTLLGNITYCVSIFAADSSPHALLINASWILGAAGSMGLDLVVLAQFWIYRA